MESLRYHSEMRGPGVALLLSNEVRLSFVCLSTILLNANAQTLNVPRHIQKFLNASDTRELIGADPAAGNFELINTELHDAFFNNLDHMHTSVEHVAALLERDIRVLIYVGSYDWIAHWVGNERWTLDMEWSGKEEFNKQPLRDWVVDGKFAGKTRSAKGLTFATVEAAGHMVRHRSSRCDPTLSPDALTIKVPYNKPKESLEMLLRWLAEEAL